MDKKVKRIGVLTSGGDAPGMNAAIRAIVRNALYKNLEVIGFYRGFLGLIFDDFVEYDTSKVSDIIQEPGTKLKTSRVDEIPDNKSVVDMITRLREKEDFVGLDALIEKAGKSIQKSIKDNQGVCNRIADVCKKHNLDVLIVIGGNGSCAAANKLSTEFGIKFSVIPATIDNDVDWSDDCIGFDTAINIAIEAIDKIRATSSSHDKFHVVRLMGRECGDLAFKSSVASGADVCIVPENGKYNIHEIVDVIKMRRQQRKQHHIGIVAEGSVNKSEFPDFCDMVGKACHTSTSGTDLGYVVRGGKPSAADRILATKMGYYSVEYIVKGNTNFVVASRNGKIVSYPIKEALTMNKRLDEEEFEIFRVMCGVHS